jgi:hypothetical protein
MGTVWVTAGKWGCQQGHRRGSGLGWVRPEGVGLGAVHLDLRPEVSVSAGDTPLSPWITATWSSNEPLGSLELANHMVQA